MVILICWFWFVFFLFIVPVSKLRGVNTGCMTKKKNMLLMFACIFSEPPCYSHDVHCCVSVFLSLCPLCPSPKRALEGDTSISSLSGCFFTSQVKNWWFDCCQLCISPLFQTSPAQIRLLMSADVVHTPLLHMATSNATHSPTTPSGGYLSHFPSKTQHYSY